MMTKTNRSDIHDDTVAEVETLAVGNGGALPRMVKNTFSVLTFGLILFAEPCLCAADLAGLDWEFTRPDYVVYVPEKSVGKQVNEHFHVLSSHKDPLKLIAFWTQESSEGAADMHIMRSCSVDGGRSWCRPQLFQGSPRQDSGIPNAIWQLPMYSKLGRLYVIWNQREKSGPGQGAGLMVGAYSDDDGKTWSASGVLRCTPRYWCSWQRPLRLAKGGRYLTAVSIADDRSAKTCFLRFENVDDNPEIADLSYTLLMDGDRRLEGEEASIVKLPDSRLFAVMRSRFGYPLWTVSADGGETWSPSKEVRDVTGCQIAHPRSPCPIYDCKGDQAASGRYFALFTDFVDPKANQWEGRGPLFVYRGVFDPKGEQPVAFTKGEKLLTRPGTSHYGNSCYSSCTVSGRNVILWYPDEKRNLLGKKVPVDNEK